MEEHSHPLPMALALVLSSGRKESNFLSGRVIRCSVNFNKSTMSFMSPGMKSQSAYFFARLAFYGFVCGVEWLLLLPFGDCIQWTMHLLCAVFVTWYRIGSNSQHTQHECRK